MTIEKKMDEMIASMNALTAALTRISSLANIPTAETKAPETKVQETPTLQAATTPKAPPITLGELSDLCLNLVRKNRNWKTKITDVIKSFGGELLKDISSEKYENLKAELKKIDAA